MIPIQLIREQPELVKENLNKRRDTVKLAWIDELRTKDELWRMLKQELDDLRHKRNSLSQQISKAKKEKRSAESLLEEAKVLPEQIAAKEEETLLLEQEIHHKLMRLPNLLHESVEYGKDESKNKVIRTWGVIPTFDFELKPHSEIAESRGVADFDRATKIAGSGFYFISGKLALLNQAIIRFAVDQLCAKGFVYMEPPHLMSGKAYEGVTDIDEFKQQMYKIEGQDLYLIATSEHPLTAQFVDEVFEESQLPIKIVGNSLCFRKEIGAHGIDTKGLFRRHQFNKVEQIVICRPEESWKFFEEMQRNAEELFQKLHIPYRVIQQCTGDIGVVAAKKYDIEVWMPRQGEYREVTSCSNATEYQSRRLNIRYSTPQGERMFVHTLNCTAVATSRVLVAILENYQQKDGSVKIPKVLVPYTGFDNM